MLKTLKELMKYAGKHRLLTYISLLLSGISAIFALIPFVYIWKIIKEAIEVMPNFENATSMIHNGWMAVIFAIVSLLLYFSGLIFSHKSAFRVSTNIRKRCMEHIMKMPIGKVNDLGSGRLRKIVVESSSSTETFLAHNLPDLISAIVTPICMVIILFIFDWKLGLLSLIPIILGFCAMSKMTGKAMQKDMEQYQNAIEVMNNEAVEYVRGMPVVKTFGQTVFSFKKFKKSIDDYDNFCISYTKKMRMPMLLFELFINSVFAFFISISLIYNANGNITNEFLFNLLFYIIYTPIITTTMEKIIFMNENIMIINDALGRVNEILSVEPLKEGSNKSISNDNDIEINNITFSYENNENKAINNLSLKIPSNSLTAFVGPSGSGKSTIANLITRFYDVNEGSIKIGGTDIRDIKKDDLVNKVSFVFQDSKLLKMSILDNVKMAKPTATDEEIKNALNLAQCDEIIEKLPDGINTIYGNKGVYLSGGEVQRINIARVILKDTPIVILDEATAFADPENEEKVQKAFENLSKNKTVIMIAHRLSSIVNAKRIFVLQEGKLVEEGNHKELLEKDGLYKQMWNKYQSTISWKVGV